MTLKQPGAESRSCLHGDRGVSSERDLTVCAFISRAAPLKAAPPPSTPRKVCALEDRDLSVFFTFSVSCGFKQPGLTLSQVWAGSFAEALGRIRFLAFYRVRPQSLVCGFFVHLQSQQQSIFKFL